jgi:hypothetical protein
VAEAIAMKQTFFFDIFHIFSLAFKKPPGGGFFGIFDCYFYANAQNRPPREVSVNQ